MSPTINLVEVEYERWVTVLFVHLAVEEDDLPTRHDHVELLPTVPPDVLLTRRLKPALQTRLCVPDLRLRSW